MLLSEARTEVRGYLDAVGDTDRWSDAEVDFKLRAAQAIVWRKVGDGTNLWTQETTALSTNASGVCDLTTLKKLRLVSVAITQGGISRWVVKPSRLADGMTNANQQLSLRIAYVTRATFPSAGGNPFVWGASVDTDVLDQAMCAIAGSFLKVKEGETNRGLEVAKAELDDLVKSISSVPRWSTHPLDAAARWQRSPYSYVMTAEDTLQLVIP